MGPNFESTLNAYYSAMLSLSNEMFHLFAVALGKNYDFFDGDIGEGMNSLNCLRYMALPAAQRVSASQMGIGAHTDYECFTLLAQDLQSPSGLEVLSAGNVGAEWKRFPPIDNTLVVNFGDIMARWSNDAFRSTVNLSLNDSNVVNECCQLERRVRNVCQCGPMSRLNVVNEWQCARM